MTNTVGPMIRKARTGAGLTQEQLEACVIAVKLQQSETKRCASSDLHPFVIFCKAVLVRQSFLQVVESVYSGALAQLVEFFGRLTVAGAFAHL